MSTPRALAGLHRVRLAGHGRCVTIVVCLALTACGNGISLDPASQRLPREENFDGGDAAEARESGTPDVSLDSSVDAVDAPELRLDGGETPEVTNIVDVSAEPSADAPDGIDAIAENSGDAGGEGGGVASDSALDADDALDANALDAGDACIPCGWPHADYYVDAQAPPDGDGSRFKPFKTITSATLAYGAVQGQTKKAYVAAGTYDRALGESFPLVLRGLSLEGAGRDRAFIVGTGTFDHTADEGPMRDRYGVTIVAGDRALVTRIAGISVRPEMPVPTLNYFGVFCDRGSATGGVPAPAGQTQLDDVVVGPGYDASVLVTTSAAPTMTGCSMRIRSSRLTGAWAGLRALGCDAPRLSGPVVVEMGGPDPVDGNTLTSMWAPGDAAAGVTLQGCVSRGVFQNNAFLDSVYGLYIDDASTTLAGPHVFSIKNNTFERLSAGGVFAQTGPTQSGTLEIDELSDNLFTNITRAVTRAPGSRAIAVNAGLMQMRKVRRNRFIGNDAGIVATTGDGQAANFGTSDDPGNNVFRCNSAWKESGSDFSFGPWTNWMGTVQMVGNAWDHWPPVIWRSDPAPNGADIEMHFNASLELLNSSLASEPCPSDRIPGPPAAASGR